MMLSSEVAAVAAFMPNEMEIYRFDTTAILVVSEQNIRLNGAELF